MRMLKSILLAAAIFTVAGAQAQIKNYSPVNYGPKDYGKNFDVENYAIAQNRLGMMYFGSANAIWEFDGKVWNRLEVKLGVWVMSILPTESTDTIFVGAENEFGYLLADAAVAGASEVLYEGAAADRLGLSISVSPSPHSRSERITDPALAVRISFDDLISALLSLMTAAL